MREFLSIAFGFPTALLTFSLGVVAVYWLLVLAGGLGLDALDGDADADAGHWEFLTATGLGGVPVSVALSLLLTFAWFFSLAGSVLVDGAGPGAVRLLLGCAVLASALVVAWFATRVLVLPLRRIFRAGTVPSRRDFVGRTCVIRTGRVGTDFGQAEVTADDGTTALIQVRVPPTDVATAPASGGTALIFDYDAADGVFLVMPHSHDE